MAEFLSSYFSGKISSCSFTHFGVIWSSLELRLGASQIYWFIDLWIREGNFQIACSICSCLILRNIHFLSCYPISIPTHGPGPWTSQLCCQVSDHFQLKMERYRRRLSRAWMVSEENKAKFHTVSCGPFQRISMGRLLPLVVS